MLGRKQAATVLGTRVRVCFARNDSNVAEPAIEALRPQVSLRAPDAPFGYWAML